MIGRLAVTVLNLILIAASSMMGGLHRFLRKFTKDLEKSESL